SCSNTPDPCSFSFFLTTPPATEIYTLSLHDALPIWTDVDLTQRGVEEAKRAGETLKEAGFAFDCAYTSVLKRAIKTLWLALETMDLMWIPVHHSWRLNERHYGALQGLNKAEMTAKFGEEQVLRWRRSYDLPPPALARDDPRHPQSDPRYAGLAESELPLTECLK